MTCKKTRESVKDLLSKEQMKNFIVSTIEAINSELEKKVVEEIEKKVEEQVEKN